MFCCAVVRCGAVHVHVRVRMCTFVCVSFDVRVCLRWGGGGGKLLRSVRTAVKGARVCRDECSRTADMGHVGSGTFPNDHRVIYARRKGVGAVRLRTCVFADVLLVRRVNSALRSRECTASLS